MRILVGKTALLTGASSGLGPFIARRLDGEGVRLVLSARRREELERLAGELKEARVIIADLSRRGEIERLAAEADEPDILIANAGVEGAGRLSRWEVDAIERAIDVNLLAPIVLTRLLSPAMVSRGEGQIVLMASMSGHIAGAKTSIYNATKFGLRGFGLALRHELYGSGVGVSLVTPGYVKEAGMHARRGVKPAGFAGEVEPKEVADAVVSAIKRNRREVFVAPRRLVVAAHAQALLPGVAERIARRVASHPAGGD